MNGTGLGNVYCRYADAILDRLSSRRMYGLIPWLLLLFGTLNPSSLAFPCWRNDGLEKRARTREVEWIYIT